MGYGLLAPHPARLGLKRPLLQEDPGIWGSLRSLLEVVYPCS